MWNVLLHFLVRMLDTFDRKPIIKVRIYIARLPSDRNYVHAHMLSFAMCEN